MRTGLVENDVGGGCTKPHQAAVSATIGQSGCRLASGCVLDRAEIDDSHYITVSTLRMPMTNGCFAPETTIGLAVEISSILNEEHMQTSCLLWIKGVKGEGGHMTCSLLFSHHY